MQSAGSVADSIEDRVAGQYSALSARLREAADFVIAHPVDVATRSLRSLSTSSGLSPATFSRLARVLGYASYEEMREQARSSMGPRRGSFAERAESLAGSDGRSMLARQSAACIENIGAMAAAVEPQRLERAVDALSRARKVLLFGALGSTGLVEYMAYLANFFAPGWMLAGRMGASLGGALAAVEPGDALLVVTKTPYARRAVLAAQLARGQGASTVLLTDSHACPAIPHADHTFIVPSESPQFFSSYAATLVLMETIIAMLVARSGAIAPQRIHEVEQKSLDLEEFWIEHGPTAVGGGGQRKNRASKQGRKGCSEN